MIGLMLLPFILLYSLIISYFCSVVIYRLCITKKYYNFFFAVLLYVASGISSFLFGFLFCPLFVWYFWRNKIIFVKITLIASICIMCLGFWQAELPQRIFVSLVGLKINITDNNYVVLEHKVWNMKDNILVTNWVQYHNFLNYISFDKADIFICDEIDCKGNKKKIGEISMPSMPRSTLGCINLTGRCLGVIDPPGLEIETFRNYLKEQSIKKTINKLN
ncbi:MAG: hypothetical protein SPH77_01040 [Campylobacter sp.]|uniref:hypothetical protein n=1 Tax=Campylobacter sp. TaxID=205 RepID=UPI002A91902B|nr:hypothetical protein [Campylobacter sp.]MDY6187405.1 hypothetical protein [Campylobacter sp.]